MVEMQVAADRIDQSRSIDKVDDFGEGSNRIHGHAVDYGRFAGVTQRDQHMRNLLVPGQHGDG